MRAACLQQLKVASSLARAQPARDMHAAIVGGGLAGCSAASALAKQGHTCTIFDMGYMAPGGRASTRTRDQFSYDHGAQLVRVSERLQPTFDALQRAGASALWEGRMGTLDAASGKLSTHVDEATSFCGFGRAQLHVGVPSMAALCYHMTGHEAVTPHWACKVTSISKHPGGKWSVHYTPKKGDQAGQEQTVAGVDTLVLADTLLAETDSPSSIDLGPAAASPIVKRISGARKKPSFSLLASYDSDSVPFDAAQIAGSDVLKLITCNSTKPGRKAPPGCSSWVAVSTTEWADGFVRDSNQEAGRKLPAKEITELAQRHLVQEFERVMQAAGFPAGAKQVHVEVQRWGSSFKLDTIEEPCLWDPELRLGFCGDLCRESSAAGAISSGLAIADTIGSK